MLVLRPADSAEATIAWEMAMNNTTTPTALIFTRQDVVDLPSATGNRYNDALGMHRGGYIVMDAQAPEVTLVANGSEVSLLCEVSQLLAEKGIQARVVSVPSLGLFEDQDQEYRNSVIPAGVPVFGLTAGLPSTLYPVVGTNARIYGLDHFGASAPFKVLDEKFGFTASNILNEVLAYINK